MQRRYTREEDDIIVANYQRVSLRELVKMLPPDRTEDSVTGRVAKLKSRGRIPIRGARYGSWSMQEDQVLEELYRKKQYELLLKRLPGRTLGAIMQRAYLIGATIPDGTQ